MHIPAHLPEPPCTARREEDGGKKNASLPYPNARTQPINLQEGEMGITHTAGVHTHACTSASAVCVSHPNPKKHPCLTYPSSSSSSSPSLAALAYPYAQANPKAATSSEEEEEKLMRRCPPRNGELGKRDAESRSVRFRSVDREREKREGEKVYGWMFGRSSRR